MIRRGHMLAMPVLVVNLGVEMIYVLEQRLRAQNIAEDKACQVVTEVIRSLLTPEFLRDMFRPQAVHPFRTLRATFQRLAHSSIMRLNEASMSKLYDLMVMALKFQCLTCGHPGRVPGEITALHVKNLKGLLSTRGSAQAAAAGGGGKGGGARDASADTAAAGAGAGAAGQLDEESTLEASLSAAVSAATTAAAADSTSDVARAAGTVADLVDAVARTMAAVYGDLSVGEQWGLYGAILGFFQDRRVRVSALLAEGLQCGDGSLVVYPPMLGPPPVGVGVAPGAFKRFDSSGKEVVVGGGGGATHFTALVELHALPGGASAPPRMDWRGLGGNIYSEKWGKGGGGGGGGVEGSSSTSTSSATSSSSGGAGAGAGKFTAGGLPTTSQPASSVVIGGLGSKQASAGLNLLSSMLLPGSSSSSGGGGGGGKDEGTFFSLDLEQLLWGDEGVGGASSSSSNSGKATMERGGGGSNSGVSSSSTGGGSSESMVARLAKKPDAPTIVRFNQGSVGGGTKALKASIHADLDGDGEGEGEGGDDSLLAMMDALQ